MSDSRRRKRPASDPLEGAVETFALLRWLHAPTAYALLAGAGGGVYLAWKLLREHGPVAIILGIIFGAILDAFVGVCAYWLARLFIAMGD